MRLPTDLWAYPVSLRNLWHCPNEFSTSFSPLKSTYFCENIKSHCCYHSAISCCPVCLLALLRWQKGRDVSNSFRLQLIQLRSNLQFSCQNFLCLLTNFFFVFLARRVFLRLQFDLWVYPVSSRIRWQCSNDFVASFSLLKYCLWFFFVKIWKAVIVFISLPSAVAQSASALCKCLSEKPPGDPVRE